MMKFLIAFIFLVFLSTFAMAQTATVRGTLIDNGRPVSERQIKLASQTASWETNTDAEGNYQFVGVPDGRYLLIYGGKGANVTVVNGDVTVAQLAEIITVSAGEDQTIEQVAKTVDVIDGQQMRERADFTLIESLRSIPGFRVAQSGGFGRLASIKTRGLRNSDTALLLDGIRFRDVTGINGDATAFLSDITLTSVSKVEVLRGSGSSLYGTNAVGGTIDFRTPNARQGTHGQVSGAFGGLGLRRFRGNLSHGTEGGKFGISAGVARTDYTKGIDGDDKAGNTNLQTRVDIRPTSRTNISGRIFFSDAGVRLNTDPDTLGLLPATNATIIDALHNVNFTSDANDPDRRQESRFLSGQFTVDHVINDKLVIGGYYQGLTTKRTNFNGPLGAGFQSASTSLYDGTVHTANAHFNWTPIRQNTLTAGYEFEDEKYFNDGRTPSGTEDYFSRAGQRSNTFYAQNMVRLLDGDLQFASGMRFQTFSLKVPGFSLSNAPYSNLALSDPPNAFTFDGSASYFVQKSGTKFRAHVGNGYRVPSLYERFGSFFNTFPSNSFIAIGDPFLKPEKSIAFDAGIEQNLAQERVRLSATYFWTRLRDVIGYGNVVPDIGSTPRPFGGYLNQKGGTSRGGEFSVKARATRTTDLFASYTFTDSKQLVPQLTGSGVFETLGVPDHQFTLVATQRYKRFWINFDFLATSTYLAPIFSNSTFSSYLYRFQGNRKGDLTAGYTFGFAKEKRTLRLFGTIENVFDNEYFENGFKTSGAAGRVGLSFGF